MSFEKLEVFLSGKEVRLVSQKAGAGLHGAEKREETPHHRSPEQGAAQGVMATGPLSRKEGPLLGP